MKVFGKQQPIQHERAKKAQQSVPGAASQSTLITQTHASRYIYLNSVVEKTKRTQVELFILKVTKSGNYIHK